MERVMPVTLTFDARGRVTIPAALRKELGREVVAIKTPHGVVLHPIPKTVRIPVAASRVTGEDRAAAET